MYPTTATEREHFTYASSSVGGRLKPSAFRFLSGCSVKKQSRYQFLKAPAICWRMLEVHVGHTGVSRRFLLQTDPTLDFRVCWDLNSGNLLEWQSENNMQQESTGITGSEDVSMHFECPADAGIAIFPSAATS